MVSFMLYSAENPAPLKQLVSTSHAPKTNAFNPCPMLLTKTKDYINFLEKINLCWKKKTTIPGKTLSFQENSFGISLEY